MIEQILVDKLNLASGKFSSAHTIFLAVGEESVNTTKSMVAWHFIHSLREYADKLEEYVNEMDKSLIEKSKT